MNIRKTIQNMFYAFFAQGLSLFMSVLMLAIVPKVLGIVEFSYWQLFLFYCSFVGFFHLGFNDGVYLQIGGKDYSEINKELIGNQIRISFAIQTIIVLLIWMFLFFFINDGNREFILFTTGIYLLVYNLSGCIGLIFQAVNQTKVFSISTIIDKTLFLIFVCCILFLRIDNYKVLIVSYLVVRVLVLIYCIYKGKELIFVNNILDKAVVRDFLTNIIVGSKLMIANISSTLVLGIGRQVIDSVWGLKAFGKFSFSISISSFFLLFISQISMVLFPALRASKTSIIKNFYIYMTQILDIILPIVYLAYFPLGIILNIWLPQYSESYTYLSLILPLCVFDGKMQLMCNTYFKVLRRENFLLFINIFSMIVSLLLSLISAFFIHNIYFVAIAMLISIAIRSVISEIYLARVMKYSISNSLILEVMFAVLFVSGNLWLNRSLSFFVIFCTYVLLLIINKKNIIEILRLLNRKVKNISN